MSSAFRPDNRDPRQEFRNLVIESCASLLLVVARIVGRMKIVTTFHQPSAVLSSVKCQLSSRNLEHLVVAKLNRIDVYSLQPHGLQHECDLEIWGKILVVRAVPISVGL